jgi:hypothetical protein
MGLKQPPAAFTLLDLSEGRLRLMAQHDLDGAVAR